MKLTKEQRKHLWDLMYVAHGVDDPEEWRRVREAMLPQDLVKKYEDATEIEEKKVMTSEGEVKIHIVQPKNRTEKTAAMVHVYGCGYWLPHCYDWTLFCRRIAADLGIVVVDIFHSLTETVEFPVPLYECYDVAKWTFAHADELNIDATKISICGHSSGGGIVAGVCLLANMTKEIKFAQQILVYPGVDMYSRYENVAERTYEEAEKIVRNREAVAAIMLYLPKREHWSSPLANAVLAQPEMVKGLPPTVLISAGEDVLVPIEGLHRYFNMLVDNGVRIEHYSYPGCIHGFINQCSGMHVEAVQDIEASFRRMVLNQE